MLTLAQRIEFVNSFIVSDKIGMRHYSNNCKDLARFTFMYYTAKDGNITVHFEEYNPPETRDESQGYRNLDNHDSSEAWERVYHIIEKRIAQHNLHKVFMITMTGNAYGGSGNTDYDCSYKGKCNLKLDNDKVIVITDEE